MTTDLWMLVWSALLYWALIMTVATPAILKNGLGWALGNRGELVELTGWHARAQRATSNLAENLILFAILVLTVHVTGNAGETSALGAQIFFGARVVHAIVYMAGIAVVRTLAWAVSILGMAIVLSALV